MFVVVRHEISGPAGVAIVEEHDIVYRGEAKRGRARPDTRARAGRRGWSHEIDPDPVLLFRYSALTFNGHRIHYDRRYATEVEGYPGLVVHGPLIATLLIDLLRRALPARECHAFSFRAISPLFDGASFFVRGSRRTTGRASGYGRRTRTARWRWTRPRHWRDCGRCIRRSATRSARCARSFRTNISARSTRNADIPRRSSMR